MRFTTLAQWLSWQEGLHPSEIELGLERVREVAARLGLLNPPHRVITVAGTNGKGSSVALLAAIYRAAGYRVGAYTSPHFLRYNERIRINGAEIDDASLCRAFDKIDRARGDLSLTYFEFGTLAALSCFADAGLDVAILEVGLGGRLDAVNIIDPDVALITAIAVDHESWLGTDRETIGREKAGIMRRGVAAVCGDPHPPQSLIDHAEEIGATLLRQGVDFVAEPQAGQAGAWCWRSGSRRRDALPPPALRGAFQRDNAAAVVAVVEQMAPMLPVGQAELRAGLAQAELPGRFQVVAGPVPMVLDVAHNPQAAVALAANLRAWPTPGRTFAITAMMADKAIDEMVAALADEIDQWYVTTVDIPRAAAVDQLAGSLAKLGLGPVQRCASVAEALDRVVARAQLNDRIVVFGSFYTVAEAMAYNSAQVDNGADAGVSQ